MAWTADEVMGLVDKAKPPDVPTHRLVPGAIARERDLAGVAALTEGEVAQDKERDASPGNLAELQKTIAGEKRPQVRALLEQEYEDITGTRFAPGEAAPAAPAFTADQFAAWSKPTEKPGLGQRIKDAFSATPEDDPSRALPQGEVTDTGPARMTLTRGGQSMVEAPAAGAASAEMDRPGTVKPARTSAIDFGKANADTRRQREMAARGGTADELAAMARGDKDREIYKTDFWRNVGAQVESIPGDYRQIMGGFFQALGEGMAGEKDHPAIREIAGSVAKFGADVADQGQAIQDQATKGLEPGLGAQSVGSAALSLARMAPALLAGVITKNPEAVIGIMSGATGASSYAQARQQGLDPGKAAAYSFWQALVEGGTEYLPIKNLLAQSGKPLATKFYNFLAREQPSEMLATALQDAADKLTIRPNMTWDQFVNDILVTALSTPLAAGVQVGAVRALAGREPDPGVSPPRLSHIAGSIQGALESGSFGAAPAVSGASSPPAASPTGAAPLATATTPGGPPASGPGGPPSSTQDNSVAAAVPGVEGAEQSPPAAPGFIPTARMDVLVNGRTVKDLPVMPIVDDKGRTLPGVWRDAQGREHEGNAKPFQPAQAPPGAAPAQPAAEVPPAVVPPAARPVIKPEEPISNFKPAEAENLGARVASEAVGKVFTPTGREVEFVWAVAPATDVQLSHDITGAPNPNFPPGMQKRDLGRAAAVQWVQEKSRQLIPEKLADSPNAGDGAPIVGQVDGALQGETGRKRTLAIQMAYREGNAGAYRAAVERKAKELGIDTAGIEHPMLVRIRTTPMTEEERVAFATEADTPEIMAMSPLEQAKADASKLSPAIMDMLDGEGSLLGPANRNFYQAFAGNVIGAGQQAAYMTADGSPTKQLADRMQAAIFQHAYMTDELTQLLAEETDPDIANILKALNIAAKEMAKLEDAGELDIRPFMAEAARLARQAKRQGEPVERFLRQEDMFGREPGVAAIALFMANNIRSAKRMGEGFTEMARFIQDELVQRQTAEMFGPRPLPTIMDIINTANKFLEEKYADKQEGLELDTKPGKTAEGAQAPPNTKKPKAQQSNGDGKAAGDSNARGKQTPGEGAAAGESDVRLAKRGEADSGQGVERLWRAYWDTSFGEMNTVPMSEAEAKKFAESKGGVARPLSDRAMKSVNSAREIAEVERINKKIAAENAARPGPPTTYINGDKVQYTGKNQILHGGKFYEFVYLEGHKKGQTGVTPRAPGSSAKQDFALTPASPEDLRFDAEYKAAVEKEKADAIAAADRKAARAAAQKETDERAARVLKERADAARDDFALGQAAPSKTVTKDEAAGQGTLFKKLADIQVEMTAYEEDGTAVKVQRSAEYALATIEADIDKGRALRSCLRS